MREKHVSVSKTFFPQQLQYLYASLQFAKPFLSCIWNVHSPGCSLLLHRSAPNLGVTSPERLCRSAGQTQAPWLPPPPSKEVSWETPVWNLHDLGYISFLFQKVSNFTKEKQQYNECARAPHSSTPAWKIPWMEEPGRLQSMGSLRVGHDWATSLSLFTFMHWRRKWQPTPVYLPGESQGRGNLVGCRLWGHTESDTTEVT